MHAKLIKAPQHARAREAWDADRAQCGAFLHSNGDDLIPLPLAGSVRKRTIRGMVRPGRWWGEGLSPTSQNTKAPQ